MGSTIRRLERSDVRADFACGAAVQDRFIREFAWQNQERYRLDVTYVAVDGRTRVVMGYVTLVAAELSPDLRGRVPVPASFRGRIPTLRIGCIAVDRRFQGRGLGRELLIHAMRIAVIQAGLSGCAGIVLDAYPDVVPFYERHRFERAGLIEGQSGVRPRLIPMFLALSDILDALGP